MRFVRVVFVKEGVLDEFEAAGILEQVWAAVIFC